uniref:SHSP domain-containing protein n=2 Tax=Caenorhabditis japonica TaxID=281687 RepID=A0A8R1HNS0_CAEJA
MASASATTTTPNPSTNDLAEISERFEKLRSRRSSNMASYNTTSSYNRTYEKKDLNNIHSSMLSNFPNLAISSPSIVGTQALTGNITSIRVTNTSFHATLDVSKFDAESLKVTVVDSSIVVEASHGEKEDTYGTIEASFKRRFPLPKAVPAESVQSQLTADGMLTIDAKAPEPKLEGARPIQIKVINTSEQQK